MYLRKAIEGLLKEQGSFADSSFNSEIVKITPNDLAELTNYLFSIEEKNKFMDAFDDAIKAEKGNIFKDLMREFFVSAAKQAGGRAVDAGIDYFSGLGSIKTLVKKAKTVFIAEMNNTEEPEI
jgi:hypothetical protein